MPRCSKCGKVNMEGAQFCQSCGTRLEAPAARRDPTPAPASEARPTCPKCNTANQAGMSFCKMCGTRLPASEPSGPLANPAATVIAAAVPPSAARAAEVTGSLKQTCPACGKLTPAGFSFCQHCGTRFATAGTPAPAPVESARERSSPTVGSATRPAGGVPVAETPRADSGKRPAPRSEPKPVVRGHLVALGADGKERASHAIAGDTFDIGRLEGALVVGTDPYLAPRHARITFSGDQLRVRSLDSVNGVFLRLREPHDLVAGDQLLVGRELLRYELLAPEERDPPALVEHGVRLLGSAQRESWARLRQLTAAGTTRDVWHLARPEIVIGRSSGDVLFPDDDLVSELHAILRRPALGDKGARIEDAGSDSGTFFRLRGEQPLRAGDVLRVGEQLLRVEA